MTTCSVTEPHRHFMRASCWRWSSRLVHHDTTARAAPAFAALAMARRSEFEGRMLAILDPRLDRNTLNRRGAFMTAAIVALLTIPLAALRPFQQPTASSTLSKDEFPSSFKVTFSDGKAAVSGAPATPATTTEVAAGAVSGAGAVTAVSQRSAQGAQSATQARWSCEKYPVGTELH